MTTATAPTPTRPRIAAVVVASAVAGLLAIAFLAAGAALLWGDSQKDADGYHATDHQLFATGANALATDNLDVDLDGAGWLVDRDGFGRIRIDAQPRAGKPLFVGIARTSDVAAYLRGTPHTTVTDVRYDPFDASYRDHRGDRAPQRPADQRFWAASAHGAGAQTVTWDVEDGDWSVVVMNEDGSRAVDAAVSAGAKVPFLAPAGWAAIGGGVLLAALAGASLLVAVRRRS